MEIINHSACNLVIGKPSDMTEEQCSALPVHSHQDENGPWCISFWKPSEEEVQELLKGSYITLWVRTIGRQHPVVALGIEPPEIIYTFEQFVQYGRDQGVPLHNGFPWSFVFHGCAVTHEKDDLYLITSPEGFQFQVRPNNILVISKGQLRILDTI